MRTVLAHPVPEAARLSATQLYLEAFWGKFGPILRATPAYAAAVFAPRLSLEHGVAAMRGETLLGVVGWSQGGRGFFGATLADLRAGYGWFGGAWRGFALSLFNREDRPGDLLMDGICVAAEARGQGVGTLLLDAVAAQARRQGCARLRLDVVDSNPRARALYERRGFRAGRTLRHPVLGPVFGFSASTEMIKPVGAGATGWAKEKGGVHTLP